MDSKFITQYLVSGPIYQPFIHEQTERNQIKYEQFLRSIIAEPIQHMPHDVDEIRIGNRSDLGAEWTYLYPCHGLVNFNMFSFTLQQMKLYASTVLEASEDVTVNATVWSYTAVELWLNGEKVCTVARPVYKPIHKQQVSLKLNKGENHLFVVVHNLAVRDTRNIFGIQLQQHPGITITDRPTDPNLPIKDISEVDGWLKGIAFERNKLRFPFPIPYAATIGELQLSPGTTELSLDDLGNVQELQVSVTVKGITLTKTIEFVHHMLPQYRSDATTDEIRSLMFQQLAGLGTGEAYEPLRFGLLYVLARWNLGLTGPHDERYITRAIEQIEIREDCSDFQLAALLRMMSLHELPPELDRRAKEGILNFRYWMTEEGSDGMCFWSENHALMFYICAYMAGERYPNDYFSRSKRTGAEVKEVALQRIHDWLDDVEHWGFEEFQSTDYMCVTMGALLNVVDYMDEAESSRAKRLIDRLFEMFSYHSFKGAIITPQARIYRSVIMPIIQSAQALMHMINPQAPIGNNEWIVFLMNSKYELPYHYAANMERELEMEYTTGNAGISLFKQQHYMLTSVQSPRSDESAAYWRNISFDDHVDLDSNEYVKSFNERFHGTSKFEAGVYGYQQHLWYAALDNDTVVFSTHPGELADEVGMRPGYWYGNGVMPAIRQERNKLAVIYNIEDDHPVTFSHLYFPMDKLEEVVQDGQWLFGRKHQGYIGIWCNVQLEKHDDRLLNCEYRAYGTASAYYCYLGDENNYNSWEDFMKSCKGLTPSFDESQLTLVDASGFELRYEKVNNITQYV